MLPFKTKKKSEEQTDLVNTYFKTKREKKVVNFAFQDFSRIHSQFIDKPKSIFIETPVYSMVENDSVKFKFRFYPSKHSLSVDAISCGTEPSAQLFVDIYLLDREGRRFNFGTGRKIECSLNNHYSESVGNFIYDREDLEKKRDKLFNADSLSVQIEVTATYIHTSDKPSQIDRHLSSIAGGDSVDYSEG
jgi:hypothetical protein